MTSRYRPVYPTSCSREVSLTGRQPAYSIGLMGMATFQNEINTVLNGGLEPGEIFIYSNTCLQDMFPRLCIQQFKSKLFGPGVEDYEPIMALSEQVINPLDFTRWNSLFKAGAFQD